MLGAGAAAVAGAARAQQRQPRVVGFLSTRSHMDSAYLASLFERGVYDAGFDESRRVKIETRWADGRYDQLPRLASDLVAQQVDVLAALGGEPAVVAARQAAGTSMPWLFVVGRDPVEMGLVKSLGHPGGNATGLVIHTLVLGPKRLDLLRQMAPKADIFGALVNPKFPQAAFERRGLEEGAQSIGRRIHFATASQENELKPAFDLLIEQGVKALVVTPDPFFDMVRGQIVALAADRRLPAIYQHREYAVDGGLMSYGLDLRAVYRKLGSYAGKVLMGNSPANLPVERMDRIEFAINLKTARSLDLQVPDSLAAFAEEIID